MKTDEYTQSDEISNAIQRFKHHARLSKQLSINEQQLQKVTKVAADSIAGMPFFTFTLSQRYFALCQKGSGYTLSVNQSEKFVPVITGAFESVFRKLMIMV